MQDFPVNRAGTPRRFPGKRVLSRRADSETRRSINKHTENCLVFPIGVI